MQLERSIDDSTERTAASDEGPLVARAKALDDAAWHELFEANYDGLRRFLHFRLRDVEAAEDLASQVFVEAIAGIERFQFRGVPIRAWLFRIARNISADHLRKQQRKQISESALSTGDDPLDLVERDSDRRRLMSAMGQLNDGQRDVVALRFIEGLSTAETARTLGKSAGAIKAMQHRALARMKQLLTEANLG